jgi:hypothetical protein
VEESLGGVISETSGTVKRGVITEGRSIKLGEVWTSETWRIMAGVDGEEV